MSDSLAPALTPKIVHFIDWRFARDQPQVCHKVIRDIFLRGWRFLGAEFEQLLVWHGRHDSEGLAPGKSE
jgi:hypothetical protein